MVVLLCILIVYYFLYMVKYQIALNRHYNNNTLEKDIFVPGQFKNNK